MKPTTDNDSADFWAAISQMVTPNTSECVAYAFEDLAAFAEGRLKRAEQAAMAAHLRYCHACRHVALELRRELGYAATGDAMVKTFGAFEARLMTALWQAGRSQTPDELLHDLAADTPEVQYAQVLSGLSSLHRRGYVKRGEGTSSQQYAAALSPADLRQSTPLFRRFMGQPALSYFLEDNDEDDLLDALNDANPPADDEQERD
ncbi:MAG: BlaI/MecI/CopY family transcriptional regulator [Armatimonadia bacterium]